VHGFVSILFFLFLPLALLFLGCALRKTEQLFGRAALLLGSISLCALILFVVPRPWGSNAVAEIIPALAGSVFTVWEGCLILRPATA
jgi:hypothetical membrane protein